MHSVRHLSFLVLATLSVAACTSSAPEPEVAEILFVPPTWAPPFSNQGMDAALVGTLEIEEPCVWIRTDIGRFTAAFPAGTVVVEGPSLQFGDGRIARSGDTLTGAGGFLTPGDLAAIQISRPVQSCFEDPDEVMVFNNQLGIEVSVVD